MSGTTLAPLAEDGAAKPMLADLGEAELLEEAAETEGMRRELEVHRLRVAYQWAVSHPALDSADAVDTAEGATLPGVLTGPDTLGGAGTPPVAAFTAETLAVATGCSPVEASAVMADVLDLVHRLPLLWDQVQAQLVPVWKARRIAAASRDLSVEAARWVDRQVAGRVTGVGPAMLDRLVAEAAGRCDPDALADRERRARDQWDVRLTHPGNLAGTVQLLAVEDTLDLTRFHDLVCAEAETLAALGDPDELGSRKAKALGVIADQQARLDLATLLGADASPEHAEARERALDRRAARTRLYLHASLTDVLHLAATPSTDDVDPADAPDPAAIGSAEGLGPVSLDQIARWVRRSRVSVQPVLHVAADDRWSVDRHDPPPRMADQVRLRDQTCVFPWCARPARGCDLDHVEAYRPPDDGGPPAQTTPANLAPLCRRHHRAKTSGRWRYRRHDPGHYLWSGPAGTTALVTPTGTVTLPS